MSNDEGNNNKWYEDIVNKINAAIPPSLKEAGQDLERNIKNIMTSGFSKLDLVSRKEFDIQTKVLLRSRKKLEALEQQLKELEAMVINQQQNNNND